MKKKIFTFLIIMMFLITSYPINSAFPINIYKQNEKYNYSLVIKDEIFDGSIILENGLNKKFGIFNVTTDGKGLHIAFEHTLFRLNIPIPTPQQPALLPFNVRIYFYYICYKDPNAQTRISTLEGEVIYEKTGPHKLFIPLLNSNSVMNLINLFDDGLIDGFAPVRWIIGFNIIPLILRDILKIDPIIPDINDSTRDFFMPLWNDSEPLFFDGHLLQNYLTEKGINLSSHFLFKTLIRTFDINLRLISRLFWDMVMPTQFTIPLLSFIRPMDVSGYAAPFVTWVNS
jgi:hypothetical protein